MDSLSQIVLGAAVGEFILGKKVGNKAPLWGAIAGTIPDLDVFVAQMFDVVTELSIHRGFSHSIVFALIASPLLALLIKKIHQHRTAKWFEWSNLVFWAFITHALLDCFTTWGTQLFWPLPHRIALQSVFVIDPMYTLPMLVCVLMVLFFKRSSPTRRKINNIGLILSSAYLLSTWVNKQIVNVKFEDALAQQNIEYKQYETRPAPLSTVLWSANIEREKDFLLGYYSHLDESPIDFFSIPKNEELLYPYRNDPKVEKLLEITEGYYTIAKSGNDIILRDLRFGMSEGWNAKGNFVFQYKIHNKPNGETEISKIDMDFKETGGMIASLWERIKGK